MTTFGFSLKRSLSRTVACVLAFVMVLSHSASVGAQNLPDITPPTIAPELVESAAAGAAQVFTIQASDDISLGDVTLHYRRTGENIFTRILMNPVGDTGFFTVVIDTEPNDLRAFEYYTQALDLNGNRTVSGFAFEPFVRTLTSASDAATTQSSNATAEQGTGPTVVTGTEPAAPAPRNRSNRKWWYIGLGVLAVGVLAAASGGGGGGGGGDITTDGDINVPLTVTIGEPIP